MKKIILLNVALIVVFLSLFSCAPAVPQEQYEAVMEELSSSQRQVEEMRDELFSTQSQFEKLRDEFTQDLDSAQSKVATLTQQLVKLEYEHKSLKTDYEGLQHEYKESQVNRAELLEKLTESTLRNPTWLELKQFLEHDDTDTLLYDEDSFDCDGFAITLRDRVSRFGYRCAFVGVSFGEVVGHALNAFETTDQGLVYIDNVKHDAIAYVEIGQPYGVISLDAVKSEYVNCDGSPNEFWGTLTWRSHDNPFSYDYYVRYRQRLEFFEQSIDAYNTAVGEYNKGSRTWSSSQLDGWLENLETLEQDLGSTFYEQMGIVENIEVYWN